jgi:hypothetical protein
MVAPMTKSSTILLSSLVFITVSLCSIQFLIPVEQQAPTVALQVSKQEFQQKKPPGRCSTSPTVCNNDANNTISRPNGESNADININKNDNSEKKKNPNYHVVFSTSCTDQQHWESMVFFYHAYKVKQPGTVTRIVSGCNAEETKKQDGFFEKYIKPMRPNDFSLHHTPDYSRVKLAEGQAYKYMNKRM